MSIAATYFSSFLGIIPNLGSKLQQGCTVVRRGAVQNGVQQALQHGPDGRALCHAEGQQVAAGDRESGNAAAALLRLREQGQRSLAPGGLLRSIRRAGTDGIGVL